MSRKKKNRKNSGQAVLEYILLLSIIIGIVTFSLRNLTGAMDKMTAKYGGTMEKQLRTGSAPASIWTK